MTDREAEVVRATEADIAGILELQAANQAENGGGLSASLPGSRIVEMMSDMPLIVARRNDRIIGFLMTSIRAMNADVPIIRAMLDAYPGSDTAYLYGPTCVDIKERGKGLAQAMFEELRRLLPGREGILFIRRDNTASFAAHDKMGMREVASFEFNGADYAVFSYFG
ncbi:MAG: GNAT family N-acetyltransferase [Deltaproteobacteria bacterium]|nr:GNAT family N-acetyltransferase [Deltaproteobacteria bacterium]